MSLVVSPSYDTLAAGWTGALEIDTAHGLPVHVPADGDVIMTEFGLFASWPGPDPTGRFIPWGEVRAIRQARPALAAVPAAAAPAHDGGWEPLLVSDHGA
jgi:hypothetical protein